MNESIDTKNSSLEPVIKPMNPAALHYLDYFKLDVDRLQTWTSKIFGRDVNLNDPQLKQFREAAELALKEIEDDLIKIRGFLAAYIPNNDN